MCSDFREKNDANLAWQCLSTLRKMWWFQEGLCTPLFAIYLPLPSLPQRKFKGGDKGGGERDRGRIEKEGGRHMGEKTVSSVFHPKMWACFVEIQCSCIESGNP